MLKSTESWLGLAIILCVVGFFSSFIGAMAVGMGVSGSGCNTQCSSFSDTVIGLGIFILVSSFFSAIYSLNLACKQKKMVIVKILGVMTTFISGSLFVFLIKVIG